MLDDLLARRFLILEHILDEVDSSARTVEFVSQQQVGRARGSTKPAMDAGAKNLLRLDHLRI